MLIAGGPVDWPADPPFVPDLAHIRDRMPPRADRQAFLIHALRFFDDVLAYAERLEESR